MVQRCITIKIARKKKEKKSDPREGGGWANFRLRGPIFGKFLAKFQKSLNFGQIIVEKCLTLEMKAFNNYFHIKENWKSFFSSLVIIEPQNWSKNRKNRKICAREENWPIPPSHKSDLFSFFFLLFQWLCTFVPIFNDIGAFLWILEEVKFH